MSVRFSVNPPRVTSLDSPGKKKFGGKGNGLFFGFVVQYPNLRLRMESNIETMELRVTPSPETPALGFNAADDVAMAVASVIPLLPFFWKVLVVLQPVASLPQ